MPESMTPLVAVGVIGALFILLLSLTSLDKGTQPFVVCDG